MRTQFFSPRNQKSIFFPISTQNENAKSSSISDFNDYNIPQARAALQKSLKEYDNYVSILNSNHDQAVIVAKEIINNSNIQKQKQTLLQNIAEEAIETWKLEKEIKSITKKLTKEYLNDIQNEQKQYLHLLSDLETETNHSKNLTFQILQEIIKKFTSPEWDNYLNCLVDSQISWKYHEYLMQTLRNLHDESNGSRSLKHRSSLNQRSSISQKTKVNENHLNFPKNSKLDFDGVQTLMQEWIATQKKSLEISNNIMKSRFHSKIITQLTFEDIERLNIALKQFGDPGFDLSNLKQQVIPESYVPIGLYKPIRCLSPTLRNKLIIHSNPKSKSGLASLSNRNGGSLSPLCGNLKKFVI